MEETTFKEIHQGLLNKPTAFLEDGSLEDKLLQKSKEKATQTAGEGVQNLVYGKKWRFHYLTTTDIEHCVLEDQDPTENNIVLKDLCNYILKNDRKKELVVCLFEARSSIWWRQFDFIKRESLKQMTQPRLIDAQSAIRELGPDYTILYDHNNAAKDNSQNDQSSSPQKTLPLSPPYQQKTSVREEKKIVGNWKDFNLDADGRRSAGKVISKSPKHKPKLPEQPQQTKNSTTSLNSRKLVSNWFLRIFRGETLDQIKKDLGKKGDPNLAWTFMENFDILKNAQYNNDYVPRNPKQILRKRPTEESTEGEDLESEEDEESVEDEEDEEDDDEESEAHSEKEELKKVVVLEDDKGRKASVNIPGRDKKTKKVFKADGPKPPGHEVLADSIAFYRGATRFNETIRSLPLFQRELAEFKKTLTPAEVQIIEKAMDKGFNPIHYIYKYKIGEKTLSNIRGGIYKKALNAPSIQLIYRYISQHLQEEDLKEEKKKKMVAVKRILTKYMREK